MSGNFTKIPDIVVGDIRIFTKGTSVNLRSEPNTTSKVIATVAATGTEIGRYAGYYANDATNLMYKWYEFSGGKYGNGWIRNDLATLTATTTTTVPTAKNDDAEAQQMLDDIVSQDKETMNNLNTAAAMIPNLQAKGVNTATSANKLTAIFARLQERQEAMQKPTTWGKVKGTITNAWGSVKNFFGLRGMEGLRLTKSRLIPKLQKSNPVFNSKQRINNPKFQRVKGSPISKFKGMRFQKSKFQNANAIQPVPETQYDAETYNDAEMQYDTDMQGVGAVLTICIIAGIAVIAGAGTTALVLCKPWKNQSNIDLKESKELKALLENADPVVAQKIREDIQSQLVDAYTVGNRQGSVSSFMSIGKYVLIAGAALWLAPKLLDYLNKRK